MFKIKIVISVLVLISILNCLKINSIEAAVNPDVNLTHNSAGDNKNSSTVVSNNFYVEDSQYENIATIKFELGEEAAVQLTVLDTNENVIEILIDDTIPEGKYCIHFKSQNKINTGGLAYKLEVKSMSGVKNMFEVK